MAHEVVAHGEEARWVVAGGARGGDQQCTRRSEVGTHRGEAVEKGRRCRGGPCREEPHTTAPWLSWKKKVRGMANGSYMSDRFLFWSGGEG